jgi:hypothetical protein
VTQSGLPADLEMDIADMERTLERVRTATSGPGPLLALQHDVLEVNRQFISVRTGLTDLFVRRHDDPTTATRLSLPGPG